MVVEVEFETLADLHDFIEEEARKRVRRILSRLDRGERNGGRYAYKASGEKTG